MPRRSFVTSLMVVPVAALVVGGLAGCTDDEEEPAPVVPTTVAVEDIDLSGVRADRAAFCDRLDEDAVAEALGGEPRKTDSYSSGDRRQVSPGVVDVVHEYGCTYRRGRHAARAWLFAQPVTVTDARDLLADRRATKGCRPAGDLAFGSPGLVQECTEQRVRRVTMAGLLGDGWLTCEVLSPAGAPRAAALERAQRWCAAMALTTGSG